ncbi:hypothetical protein ACFE04_022566 [Oxalis oulophora]
MASSNTIRIITSDDGVFDLESSLAMEFPPIKAFFSEATPSPDTKFPLTNVTSSVFSKIVAYTTAHLAFTNKKEEPGVVAADVDAEMKAYDAKFVEEESNQSMIELILGSNYVEAKGLLELLTKALADRIKNKSVEYVRKLFMIDSDFTDEEEAKLRADVAWSFEGVDKDDDE